MPPFDRVPSSARVPQFIGSLTRGPIVSRRRAASRTAFASPRTSRSCRS